MENLYSVEFFLSFVESLQRVCQQNLSYNQFVEVSGYVCVEIDNMKKERYVLSELLQSCGNVVSESYCTKAFKTSESEWIASQNASPQSSQQFSRKDPSTQNPNRLNTKQPQRTQSSSQSVFPKQSSSDSMMLPVNPVLQTRNLPEENASIILSKERIQPRSVEQDFNIVQFNIQKPVSGKTECYSEHYSEDVSISTPLSTTAGSRAKRRKHSLYTESTPLQSPASTSNHSYSSESEVTTDPVLRNLVSEASNEIQVTLPRTLSEDGDPKEPGTSNSSVEATEVIDLDMFDDEIDNCTSFQEQNLSEFQSDLSFDVSNLISQSQKKVANPGSLSVLRSVVKRFKKYHFEKSGQDIDPLNIPPNKLNEMLLDFFTGAKKMDGSDLTVGSLKNTQVYMERYLKQGGYPYSITRDDRFKPSRDYIKARQEESSKNKLVLPHVPVDNNDIEVMFQKNVIGLQSPDSLFNTLWLMNSKFFAKKKPGEHFSMKWGDVQLNTNNAGQEFLERPINDAFSLKVFAKPHDPDRCFVNFYKQYRDMRPKGTLDEDHAFYLKMNKTPSQGSWFLPEPMTWSPFTYVWKKIVMSTGLSVNKRLM